MPMSPDDLRQATAETAASLPPLLRALRHDAQGDWNAAHQTAQDIDTPDGAWVHAYLHRREGDLGNAAYWYRRAGKPIATGPLPSEWNDVATALLSSTEAYSPRG